MDRTATIPTESIVTFNKHGITKVEHLHITELSLTQEAAEALLRLMGTTAEEVVEAYETKQIISQKRREVNHGKSYKSC